jgi:hypothetical protein
MKKILTVTLLAITTFTSTGFCGTLYEALSRKNGIKTYVALPKDSTGKDQVITADLKKSIEDALSKRKSLSFAIVPGPEEAELVIDTEVTEFFWSDHDPVDMIMGLGATAMDAAVNEHYARMQAVFTISDKSGKVIWKEKLKATLTHPTMTEKESIERINPDMAQVLVKEAFSKKRSR